VDGRNKSGHDESKKIAGPDMPGRRMTHCMDVLYDACRWRLRNAPTA